MATDTSVKFFHCYQIGSPSLIGNAGGLNAVLQACLVDGFGAGSVDSITVSAGVATVTRSLGHPFEVDQVSLIAGASPSQLNGEKKVLSVAGNTYTFAAPGVPDGAASGTITQKVAPLGWERSYQSGNVSIYKPLDVAASGGSLRVDDSSRIARVIGVESASGVNSYGPSFPTSAQISGGGYWNKSNVTDANDRAWFLIGDGQCFYLFAAYSTTKATSVASPNHAWSCHMFFGDPVSLMSPDAFGITLAAAAADLGGTTPGSSSLELDHYDITSGTNGSIHTYSARSYTGRGTSVNNRKSMALVYAGSSASGRSGNGSLLPYPNPAGGGLLVSPVYLAEQSAGVLRAALPGFYGVQNAVSGYQLPTRSTRKGIENLPGRTLMAFNSSAGAWLMDVTGPWR